MINQRQLDIMLKNFGNTVNTAPKPNPDLKGVEGENCNRTACQKPKSAHYLNRVTNAHYCLECAKLIEAAANRDNHSFFKNLPGEIAFFDEAKGLWFVPSIGNYHDTKQDAINEYNAQ